MFEPSRRVLALAAAFLCTVVSIPAARAEDTPRPIPESLQVAVEQAQTIGRRLFGLDRAAWVATDTLLADRSQQTLSKSVRGWITREHDLGVSTHFYDDSNPPRRLYDVTVESSGRTESGTAPTDAVFDATDIAMIRARTAAMLQTFQRCSRHYNTVVYPQAGGVHVYLMPGTTVNGVHPAGGHHLFVYDGSGQQLLSQRGFTRSCIDLEEGNQEQAATALFITHLLDPQPTEIHVFISLGASVPLYVSTTGNARTWKVDKGVISLVALADDPS